MRKERIKMFYLPLQNVIDVFIGNLKIINLPDDIIVLSVEYSLLRQSLGFLVWSATFDVVQEGFLVPEIVVEIEVINGEVK